MDAAAFMKTVDLRRLIGAITPLSLSWDTAGKSGPEREDT
jgi:hypothetical protein